MLLVAILCVISLSFIFVACDSKDAPKTNKTDVEEEVAQTSLLQAYDVIAEQIEGMLKSGTYDVTLSYKVPDLIGFDTIHDSLSNPKEGNQSVRVKVNNEGVVYNKINQSGTIDETSGAYYLNGYQYDFTIIDNSEDPEHINCSVQYLDPIATLSLISETDLLNILVEMSKYKYTSISVVESDTEVAFVIKSDFSSIANKVLQAFLDYYDKEFSVLGNKIVDIFYNQTPLAEGESPSSDRKTFDKIVDDILSKMNTISIITENLTIADLINLLPQDIQGSINEKIELISNVLANKLDIDINAILSTKIGDIFTELKSRTNISIDELKASIKNYLNNKKFVDIINRLNDKGEISFNITDEIERFINLLKVANIPNAELSVSYVYNKETNKITHILGNATGVISMSGDDVVPVSLGAYANFEIKIVDLETPTISFPTKTNSGQIKMLVDFSDSSLLDPNYYVIELNSLPFAANFVCFEGEEQTQIASYDSETNKLTIDKTWVNNHIGEEKMTLYAENDISILLKVKKLSIAEDESDEDTENDSGDDTP